jgi:hypothetical protein
MGFAQPGLERYRGCNVITVAMPFPRLSDPLALSAGAAPRLLLAAGVLALLWAAVAWARAV